MSNKTGNLYCYRATVLRVVDGDTIDVLLDLGFGVSLKERIRFYGVNAPESRTRDADEKVLGLAAMDFVIQWVERYAGEIIIRTTIDKRGKFGRILGEIINSDGDCLNDEMLEKGHAVEYFGGKR